MSLKNMTLFADAAATVAGTATMTFAPVAGMNVSNGLYLACTSDTNYQTRRSIVAKVRPPALDPKTGEFGKDKKSMSLVTPFVLTSGKVIFATIRNEIEIHPEMNADDIALLRHRGAQMYVDTNCVNFWTFGSTE